MKNMRFPLIRFWFRPIEIAPASARKIPALRKVNLQSGLNDGLLPAVVLILITLLVPLFYYPLVAAFGSPGLLVYTLFLLAVGTYALNRCIVNSFSEVTRAWYGMLTGLFLWLAIESTNRLGYLQVSPVVTFLLMILAVLVIMTLWRPVFPLGVKFAVMIFMLNWTGRFLIITQVEMAQGIHFFLSTVQLSGFLALAGVVFFLMWMLYRAESKIHRMWAAVGTWFCVLLMMIIFFGIVI